MFLFCFSHDDSSTLPFYHTLRFGFLHVKAPLSKDSLVMSYRNYAKKVGDNNHVHVAAAPKTCPTPCGRLRRPTCTGVLPISADLRRWQAMWHGGLGEDKPFYLSPRQGSPPSADACIGGPSSS